MTRKPEEKPAEPPRQEALLQEIRDLLAPGGCGAPQNFAKATPASAAKCVG